MIFWLHWVLVATCGLSLVAASGGGHSLVVLRECLIAMASGCGAFLGRLGFSSCGTQAWLPRCTWDLPGPGIEPMASALAGAFLTSGPPGKPQE